MQLTIIIILLIILLYLGTQIYHIKIQGRAPWLSSSKQTRQTVINHLELQPGQIFAELGAGTGTLARQLAKKYPTNQIYAYEISYLPFLIGSLLAGRQANLNFIRGDINKADLSMVDAFYIFTNQNSLNTLAPKLSKYPKSALLYSNNYQIPDQEIKDTLSSDLHPIYLYKL